MRLSGLDATTVAAVAAIGTLFGVLVNAAGAYITVSRSAYVSSITSARIKWIESIRSLIIEFKSLHLKAWCDLQDNRSMSAEDLREIIRVYEALRLTCVSGAAEKNILRLARCCLVTICEPTLTSETLGYSEMLSRHAAWFIELERIRAKKEASTALMQHIFRFRMWKEAKKYSHFCETEGNFTPPAQVATEGDVSLLLFASPASSPRP